MTYKIECTYLRKNKAKDLILLHKKPLFVYNELKSESFYNATILPLIKMKNDEYIMDIVNKYGNNYPITIVPKSSGGAKQVMIGPITIDEYGALLERFKSYGYKDAFLRKIR